MQKIGMVLVLLAVAMPFAVADGKATVNVEVQINDQSSAVDEGVEGAHVSLRDEKGKEFGDYADEGGLVILNDVPPGFYTLVASADGFRDATREVEVSKEISSFLIKLARDD
jgi:hypothetical protein